MNREMAHKWLKWLSRSQNGRVKGEIKSQNAICPEVVRVIATQPDTIPLYAETL